MCRNPKLLATAACAAMLLGAVGPAAAMWPLPSKAAGAPANKAPTPDPKPQKATAQQRAEAQRLEPLARAAFWTHEVDIDPTDVSAGDALAAALRALGRHNEATTAADRVLVVAPKDLDALLEAGRSRIAADQGFYAIDYLQRAEAVAPRDWRPVALMGVALEQSRRPDDARTAFARALQMAPNDPGLLNNYALFEAQQGRRADAEAMLRRAAGAPGATAQERQNLALVLGLEGKFAEAERLMRADLPPDAADANLAYVKAAAAHGGVIDPHSWSEAKTAGGGR